MDSERTHRTGSSSSGSSELFICFTSRLSSSSMKISSKSILSPGRADNKFREPQISLSSSLSRRLRSNGSMKGGQCSPMFPTGNKKRGCAFDNPEPSSPKVTCIGQVRVKTKKQGKKLRTRSTRRGEVSFRKIEQSQESVLIHPNFQRQQSQQQQQECLPHRNQRWVHLPLTICEALRAFGAEFNCFLPCRSSCLSTSEREKEEKTNGSTGESENASARSCGAVFARWLVALQEGEGKGREIELVVGEEERTERSHYQRRQVMEEIDIKEEEKDEIVEAEEGRVSICVPPKNALLLMRCRSDPLRMAALANRFWESPVPKVEDDEDEEDEDGHEQEQGNPEEGEEKGGLDTEHGEVEECDQKWVLAEAIEEHEIPEEEAKLEDEHEDAEVINPGINEVEEGNSEKQEKEEPEVNHQTVEAEAEAEDEEEEEAEAEAEAQEEEAMLGGSSTEAIVDPEVLENESKFIQEEEDQNKAKDDGIGDEERRSSHDSSVVSVHSEEGEEEDHQEAEAELEALEEEEEESTEEKETTQRASQDEETVTHERSEPETHETEGAQEQPKSEERESHANLERESSVLPDCLLMMMCEPKLSMEVSKETWVCGTDFVRWLPERPVIKTDGVDEPKKRVSTDSNPAQQHLQQPQLQPPRSSCSFPAGPAAGASMATMIEKKLGNAVAYEPFVLTRCKSEPMRSAAKLMPEACFWKNRKLEPHRGGAALGVGAAGVGF